MVEDFSFDGGLSLQRERDLSRFDDCSSSDSGEHANKFKNSHLDGQALWYDGVEYSKRRIALHKASSVSAEEIAASRLVGLRLSRRSFLSSLFANFTDMCTGRLLAAEPAAAAALERQCAPRRHFEPKKPRNSTFLTAAASSAAGQRELHSACSLEVGK